MASKAEPGKKYLSHTLAEWACGLKYEDLSPKSIETAKLFWYDSIGCALGGSQQLDAKILLEHHREMNGEIETERRRDEATKGEDSKSSTPSLRLSVSPSLTTLP